MNDRHTFIGYIGTYTKGASQGLYSFHFNSETAMISELTLVAELIDPTYLSISPDNNYLYANYKADGKGAVASFNIDTSTGALSLIGTSISENGSYCYVSSNREGNALVAASYGDGLLESYHIQDGSLSPVISTVRHHGSGPNLDRQEKAHAHYAQFTPDGNYIAVVDLGIDQVLTYRLEADQLQLVHTLRLEGGSGPRHLVFHPTQPFAYVIAELRPEVIALRYDPCSGRFETMQTIRSVPADFIANNQGSAIHIPADGRFVYAANRGHDSIAVFSVDERSGTLSLVQLISTEGHWPRDFALDPTETFLIASNEESGTIILYARDPQTGTLTLLQADIQVPYPVCVKFLQY